MMSELATATARQTSPLGPPTAGRRTGTPDEEVTRWLHEYVRRRDRKAAGDTSSRQGDTASLEDLKARISYHYTGLVESIARRFQATGEPIEDLSQEGFLGLLSALEHFNPAKNVKFSTYATHFIAGAIRHCLRDRGKIIKEPAWLHELNAKINRTSEALTQKLGRAPQAAEIAQALNLTEEAVEEFLMTRQVFRVAAFESSPDDGSEAMAGLVDPEKIRSDKYVTLQLPIEDRIVLEEAAQKLKALEQKVIYEFFYKDRNQTEIAKQFDISCNYVSHILKNATSKLRKIVGEGEVRDRLKSREQSVVDAGSGLYTRQHMTSRLNEEISRSARASNNLSILLIDLTCAKTTKGSAGEAVWVPCGDAVRQSIRRMDLAAKFGDDQVLVLLPETGHTVSVVAERLTRVLGEAGAKAATPFTVRVGTAVYPDHGRNAQELLAKAAA
jgi:RNA polymerase sigma-B factor